MDDTMLFSSAPPGIHLLVSEESSLANHMISWTENHSECAIRRIRGQKSINKLRFFDEVAAALQFPYYFGENWDAFDECIRDLSWIPYASFLVIIDSANLLLQDSDRDFFLFLEGLSMANKHWRELSGLIQNEMQPVRFQSLLACSGDAFLALLSRVEAANVPFSLLKKP